MSPTWVLSKSWSLVLQTEPARLHQTAPAGPLHGPAFPVQVPRKACRAVSLWG